MTGPGEPAHHSGPGRPEWAPAGGPWPVCPSAGPVLAVAAGDRLHAVTATDGGHARHVAVGGDLAATAPAVLPLRSVSGLLAAPGRRLMVCGRRSGDGVPVLVRVDPAAPERLGPGDGIALEGVGPAGDPRPLVATGDGAWICWRQTGPARPGLRLGHATPSGLSDVSVAVDGPVVSVRVDARGPVADVLCYLESGDLLLLRVGARGIGSTWHLPLADRSAATFGDGGVLTPGEGGTVEVWLTAATVADGRLRRFPVPGLPRLARVQDPRTVTGEGTTTAFLWTTAEPEDGHAVRSRGWLCALDPDAWRAGTPVEHPGPAPLRAACWLPTATGPRLVVVHGTTTLHATAWAPRDGAPAGTDRG